MRKINYPLIVTDFDGTLVKEDGTISEITKRSITEYIQNGGHFVISTGRMPAGILPRARELGLKGMLSCGQGAVILDIDTKQTVFESRLPNKTAVAICKKMESLGLHIHVYTLWEYYSNMDDDALKDYENVVKSKAIVVTEQPISEYVEKENIEPYKIMAMVYPEDNERILNAMKAENFPNCYVTRSNAMLVELGNANNSKGTAVTYLAKHYGIPLEKTIAVGDQINDLSMLEVAGLGLAVKNADQALKERVITLDYTNEEDALKEVIEKYGYEKA
ncbi:MAG: HAD family phosphatase [Clostridia bacterium]|nr:HAD family phosphatase [Clostridia bacterium]